MSHHQVPPKRRLIVSEFPRESWNEEENEKWCEDNPLVTGCWYRVESSFFLINDYCWRENEDSYLQYDVYVHVFQFLNAIQQFGIGLNDNFVVTVFLSASVCTGCFIMMGLNRANLKDVDTPTLTSTLAVSQLLLLTSFLMMYPKTLAEYCEHPSLFHIVDYLLTTLVCTIWAHYNCSGTWRRNGVFLFTLAVPILVRYLDYEIGDNAGHLDWRFLHWPSYIFSQTLFLFCLYKLSGESIPVPSCLKSERMWCWVTWVLLFMLSVFIQYVVMFSIMEPEYLYGTIFARVWINAHHFCVSLSVSAFANPMFVGFSVLTVWKCQHLRIFPMLYGLVLLSISSFSLIRSPTYDYDTCFAMFNVTFFMHSLFVPVFILLLFWKIPELKGWFVSVFGMCSLHKNHKMHSNEEIMRCVDGKCSFDSEMCIVL